MSRSIGLDYQPDCCRVAVVDTSAGRPQVLALETAAIEAVGQLLDGADHLIQAVPDQIAIVKRLRSPGGEGREAQDRLTFELAQCLLDDASQFVFRFHTTADSRYVIGAALRRQVLENLRKPSLNAAIDYSYQLRSIAIGQAYMTFCRRAGGTLVAVADIGDRKATLCLVYDNQIADVAGINHAYDDLATVDQQERLAIDLKTVVNFRLASLMDQGISQPLAGLVISGDGIDDASRRTIQRYFPVGVTPPVINTGFFEPERLRDLPTEQASRFLVALGLAVN